MDTRRDVGQHQWADKIDNGQLSRVDDGSKIKVSGAELHVRPGLEIVVPSVSAVKAFLGEADFQRVEEQAAGRKRGIDVPLVARLLQMAPGAGTWLVCRGGEITIHWCSCVLLVHK